MDLRNQKGASCDTSSDAHRPEEIDGYYLETLEILRKWF
jgi:histidinol phosphatase-like PHP family hydrolase